MMINVWLAINTNFTMGALYLSQSDVKNLYMMYDYAILHYITLLQEVQEHPKTKVQWKSTYIVCFRVPVFSWRSKFCRWRSDWNDSEQRIRWRSREEIGFDGGAEGPLADLVNITPDSPTRTWYSSSFTSLTITYNNKCSTSKILDLVATRWRSRLFNLNIKKINESTSLVRISLIKPYYVLSYLLIFDVNFIP